jgi:starvation-inducible DNA-binding protein
MSQVTNLLNTLVATSSDFYFTYKFFHWNITGEDFYEFHKLFDAHAATIFETIDPTAERIRQLNDETKGELAAYLELSRLDQQKPVATNNIQNCLVYILAQHKIIIALLEEIISLCENDYATADLLTGFLEKHQQMHWFIQSSTRMSQTQTQS